MDKKRLKDKFITLINKRYPNWKGCTDKRYIGDEREYKLKAVQLAQDLLSKQRLMELVEKREFDTIIENIKKVGKETNLLYLSTPSSGDLKYIMKEDLDVEVFSQQFFKLLYDEKLVEDRITAFNQYILSTGERPNWTFSTYFLYLLFPKEEILLKPESVRWFFKQFDHEFKNKKDPGEYLEFKSLAREMLDMFSDYAAKDMIDVDSLLWITFREEKSCPISIKKEQEFFSLLKEYSETFLFNQKTLEHFKSREKIRERGREHFKEALKRFEIGEDVTDFVLSKLLPYSDSEYNQSQDNWIHFAPVFKGDVKKKYSNFIQVDDWKKIAVELLTFIQHCTQNPKDLKNLCKVYGESIYSKGFQSGSLTPVLNAFDPDQFSLINSKPLQTMKYFCDKNLNASITDYDEANNLKHSIVNYYSEKFKRIKKDLPVSDKDVFDYFTHWLVAVKGYGFGSEVNHEELLNKDYDLDVPQPDYDRDDTKPENAVYTLEQIVEETGLDASMVYQWKRALERKQQVIFYGPPGTGKTFVAEKLARHVVGGTKGQVEIVQFHPSYSYEDFIEGIRPQTDSDGNLSYPVKKGRFYKFCEQALKSSDPFVLIIDEINRANLSRVFGELMFLLEYRSKSVKLAVSGKDFSIPENVFLIGTMNTADRSIALVDHALRRRFAFLKLSPEMDVIRKFNYDHFSPEGLIGLLNKINENIEENYRIGVSFFLSENLDQEIDQIWQLEIEPYLEEYFFDEEEKINNFRWEKIKNDIF